ncbi:MAG: tryptophan 2,3-dioxygenase family protein [Pirellulales bacterium]|nr:tryptophan 2,3-dioxygenase family protein [Pirellulales bacterium]
MSITYGKYLKVTELLGLQAPLSEPEEHDELLFITVHQTYELWFKQLLHELDKVCQDFSENRLFAAIATFKRLRIMMKVLVAQLDILETMTPMSFTSFRDRLETSSGFQSWQFREFEFLLGYKRPEVLKYVDPEEGDFETLRSRLSHPSLIDHFYKFLDLNGITIPAEIKNKDVEQSTVANVEIQNGIFSLYRNDPRMEILFESMADFDEGLQEWRYRHVKVVERTIGAKHGTGGSLGVEFLKKSLFQPIFPDLWAVRHRF